MKITKILFLQCSALIVTFVLAGSGVYAANSSLCHSGANILLHNDGSLKACQLKDDYVANDVRCKIDGPVSFYNNGNLESCVLSAEETIGENKCKQNGPISFYIDGKLKSCMKPD
jgi:hypothetical protein